MNHCSNHLSNHMHCCHKVQAWVQEQYIEKRNRSPYRQKSFQKTLRTYAPSDPLKSLLKSKSLSKFGLKESRSTVNLGSKENREQRLTEGTPTEIINPMEKEQSPTKDKLVFREIEQSNSAEILPFNFLPFTNSFEKVVLESSQLQLPATPINSFDPESQLNSKETPIGEFTPMQLLEEILNSTPTQPSQKRVSGRKFSMRLIKRQFKSLWSKSRIQELVDSIIRSRDLFSIGEEHEIKAKLYALLINQLP